MSENKFKLNVHFFVLTDTIIASNFISNYMSRNRFTQLLRYIHFAFNKEDPTGSNDKLWKIRDMKNFHIFSSFSKTEYRLHFKQFIPSKGYLFGINFSLSCFLFDIIITNEMMPPYLTQKSEIIIIFLNHLQLFRKVTASK